MPLSATASQSGGLAAMGGKLYQQATSGSGTPYTFQSNLQAASERCRPRCRAVRGRPGDAAGRSLEQLGVAPGAHKD